MRKNKIQKFTLFINKRTNVNNYWKSASITIINQVLKTLQKLNNQKLRKTKCNNMMFNLQESNLKNEVFWTIYKK